jgi:phosphatidylethanolamine/phosphatidyl-N-methylethanolamine N-methyltransferase
MNNHWNQIIYKCWSPFYDQIFNSGPFLRARRKVFSEIQFTKGDKILFVGVGTGVDLLLVPHEKLDITAIDYSQDMLTKAVEKFPNSDTIQFLRMDAQSISFPDETYDYVIASLILSVVPNYQEAYKEMMRVTKANGKIIIFDKFIRKGQTVSIIQKIMKPIVKVLGTDIGIPFEEFERTDVEKIKDEELLFKGMYRGIHLQKLKSSDRG